MAKLLVIDDKPDNLVVVQAICRKKLPDLEVITALSGEEALQLAVKEMPDTILLDIIMPNMDGYEVCRRLKAKPNLSVIPVILVTAILTNIDARVKGLEMGADAFLNKPINENELVAQIKVMLRIKAAEDALRLEKSELEDLVEERTEVLLRSEQKFRALYDNAPLSYQSLDGDGRFVDVNPTWLNTLGYDREAVIGSYFKDYLHPDWQDHFEKSFPTFKRRGYVHDVHFKIRHQAGHYLDVSFEGCIGYAADGSFKQTYCVFQDITESLIVKRALESSEEQFRRAVINSPIPMMIHDEKDNILQLSKGWTDSSGYALEDIPTLSDWTRQAYGSASGTEKKYIDELFEIDKTTANGEWTVTTKEGSQRIWDFQTTPLGTDTQGLRLLLSLAVDITEEKEAQEVVLAEKLFNESMISSLPGVFYLISEEGKFLRWNKNFEEVTGRSSEEMSQIGPVELFEGKDKVAIASAVKRVFTHGEVQVIGRIVAKNGQKTPFQFSGKKIIVDGAPCLVGLGMDISEQVKTQMDLRSKDVLISTSARLTQIGGFELNLLTGEGIWTRGTFLIYGLDPEGPTPPLEEGINFYTPEARPIIKELVERAIQDQKPYDVELPFINARGEHRWVRSLGQVEVVDGKTVRLFGAIQDITDRKQGEVEKEDALLEAKHANEVKDQFIANISHEIRTPLNSILGFSDLFKQRYSDAISDKDQVIFDYITESSERLMHTVDSILNMSMLKSGTISVHKEVVNLSQMTTIIVNNFKVQAEKKNLSIELIDSEEKAEVFVDKNCVNSAISNLTDNAIKYTDQGDIKLTLKVVNKQVTLSIQDTGIGISEGYKQRAFEPYTQESEGFTKVYQGVGLGLAITKQFLDLNDVEIDVETQKNVGTTFTLTFPEYEAEDNAK